MLGLRVCARAFSSCCKRGPFFIAVRGPLTITASLVAEHRLQMRRLSSCGSRAQLLCGMWDLPRPGLEPVSPASAGRFSTTAPPGKPLSKFLAIIYYFFKYFPSHALFRFFWDSNGINVSSLVYSHRPLRLCSFYFSLFSLCCPDLVISIVLFFSSPILSSIPSILLLSLSAIHFGYWIFQFQNSHLVPLHIFYFFSFFFLYSALW